MLLKPLQTSRAVPIRSRELRTTRQLLRVPAETPALALTLVYPSILWVIKKGITAATKRALLQIAIPMASHREALKEMPTEMSMETPRAACQALLMAVLVLVNMLQLLHRSIHTLTSSSEASFLQARTPMATMGCRHRETTPETLRANTRPQ